MLKVSLWNGREPGTSHPCFQIIKDQTLHRRWRDMVRRSFGLQLLERSAAGISNLACNYRICNLISTVNCPSAGFRLGRIFAFLRNFHRTTCIYNSDYNMDMFRVEITFSLQAQATVAPVVTVEPVLLSRLASQIVTDHWNEFIGAI